MKAYSTGEVADFCGVTLRTVIRWLEKGLLKGYKLPGRGNNRILPHDLLAFLKSQNMPIPAELEIQPKQHKVLVVDDDELMARGIQRIVAKMKLTNEVAFDAFEAGHKLHSFRPSIMVLDLQMPSIDGYKVISKIRSTEEFSKLKIIVVSGSDDAALQRALDLGADATLKKPFQFDQLEDLISRHLH